MDRSNMLFRLLFRVEAHSTTARVADYGCQREQRAVLSNQHGRLIGRHALRSFYYLPRFVRRITRALLVHDGTRAVQFRPIDSTARFAIYREFQALTATGCVCITFRIYRIILSYYVFISAANHVNPIILRFLRLLEVVGISRLFLFSVLRWILFIITRENFVSCRALLFSISL